EPCGRADRARGRRALRGQGRDRRRLQLLASVRLQPAGRRPAQHPTGAGRSAAPPHRGRRAGARSRVREQPDGRPARAGGRRGSRAPAVFQLPGRDGRSGCRARRAGRAGDGHGVRRAPELPRRRFGARSQVRRLGRVERDHGESRGGARGRPPVCARRPGDPDRSPRDVRGRAAADGPCHGRGRVPGRRGPGRRLQSLLPPARTGHLRESLARQRGRRPDHAGGEVAGRDPEGRRRPGDGGTAVRRRGGPGRRGAVLARGAGERRRVVHRPGGERRDTAALHHWARHAARLPRADPQDLVQHAHRREKAALDRLQRGRAARRRRHARRARRRSLRLDPRRRIRTATRQQRAPRLPGDRHLERRRDVVRLPRIGYRWTVCALLFVVTTVNYIDRQVLGILAPTLQRELHWTESQYGDVVSWFSLVYAFGFLAAGRVLDRVGVRRGFAVAIVAWSVAAIAHAFARTAAGFSAARALLGLGESANFPGAIKTVAEWFPKRERALATGIFNAGTNTGAIITPLVVPWIVLRWGWQWAFIATGSLGFLWLVLWLALYRSPETHPRVTQDELAHIRSDPGEEAEATVPWIRRLGVRQTWAFAVGKLLADPIWWSYLYWLPKFLDSPYGVKLAHVALPLIVVYLVAD